MPKLIIPSHIDRNAADELRSLAPILMSGLNTPDNLHNTADAAYKKHLEETTGTGLFDEVCTQVDNAKSGSEAFQTARQNLHHKLVAYAGLSDFLASADEDSYNSDTLRGYLDALTGANGLSEAVREFDRLSGYAFTKSPALKTLTTMAGFAEKIAMRVEALGIRQRDDDIRAQNTAAAETIAQVDTFNEESVRFVASCLNEGIHVGEPRELENARSEADRLEAGFHRKADMYEKSIAQSKEDWQIARGRLFDEEFRLQECEDAFNVSEENAAEAESRTIENNAALTDLEKRIAEYDAQIEDQEAELRIGIRNFDLDYERTVKKITPEDRERYKVLNDALANVRDAVRQAEKPDGGFAELDEASTQNLINVFRKGRGANKLSPAESKYYFRFCQMADTIDLLNPDAKRTGGGLFQKDHTFGVEKVLILLGAHVNKLKASPEKASLKAQLIKEMNALDDRLTTEYKIMESKNSYLEAADDVLRKKGEFLSVEQPKLDALTDKKQALVKEFMRLKESNLKNEMDRPNSEAKKELQKEALTQQQKKYDEAAAAVKETENRAQQAEAGLESVKASLKNIGELRAHINAIDRKIQFRQEDHAKLSKKVDTVRKGFVPFAALEDNRLARCHEKLTEFAAHIDENKGWHHNGSEYTRMSNLLRTAVTLTEANAVDADGNAVTPDEIDAALNALADSAKAYVEARSHDFFQHGSAFRNMRLNFARELSSFVTDAAENLRVKATETPDLETAAKFSKPTRELLPESTYQNYYRRLSPGKSEKSLTGTMEKLGAKLAADPVMKK